MAGKKERWGAYVKPTPWDRATGHGDYIVSIGKFDENLLEKGEMFTSNPEISRKIAAINREHDLNGKVLTGVVSFFIREPQKEVRIVSVIPFTGGKAKLPKEFGKRLMGLGLASRIELRVLEDLEKKFPGYGVAPLARAANSLRQRMVQKRGTNVNRIRGLESEVFPMREEIQRIADYIGLKGMEKRHGKAGVERLLAAREKARKRRL